MTDIDRNRKQILDFIGITEQNLNILKDNNNLINKNSQSAIDYFYKKIKDFELTNKMLQLNSTIERITEVFKVYFQTISQGYIDQNYIKSREKIGAVHSKIGLSPEWFLSACSFHFEKLSEKTDSHDFIVMLNKILCFDSIIILAAYQKEGFESLKSIYDNSMSSLKDKITKLSKLSSSISNITNEFKIIGINSHIEANRTENVDGFKVVSKRIRVISEEMKGLNIKSKQINLEIYDIFSELEKSFNDYLNSIK